MRVVDRRIRTVARAVDDYSAVFRTDELHRPGWTDNPAEWEAAVEWRAGARRDAIATAVNILEVLDTDIIDQWDQTTNGERAFTVGGWVELPHDMRDNPPDRVQVTVRRLP